MKNFKMTTVCKNNIMDFAEIYSLTELDASIAVSALIMENRARFKELMYMVKEIVEEDKEND